MDDLFLRTIVRSYTDLPRFVRRDWLAASLDAQLADPGCRFVLLTAEPGAGKSAFLAQLAADHPHWPVYFIRRDQRTAFEGTGARSLLLRVGFQLAALHPELYSIDQVRLEVEQRLGHVEGEEGVVGVEVERLIASPFHKTLIRVTQDIQTAGASVTGIRIEEWVATPRLISLDDLQNLALLDPARAFARQRPDARIVILIDALDELRYQKLDEQRDQQPDEGLLAWLASLPELPDNIRIVMTSRPMDTMLAYLRQKQHPYLRELTISTTDQLVQGDLETYARRLVEPPSIRGALAAAGREPAAFVTEIVLKADGNIGYLGALGRAVDQAAAAPERRALLDELLTLTRLPDDTQGLFAFFLRQIKTRGGARGVKVQDPASGRTAVLEAWPEVFHPILALLSVNLEPLTIEQIHALCGTLADRSYVIDAVQWLDQFLDRVGHAYRLYHTTLAEFLTSAGTRDDPDTTDFYVYAEAEHRRLAALLEAAGGDAIWINSEDRLEQARREYARQHLVRHLALGRDWDRLYRVIDDGHYGRGKLRADPSTFFYSLDIDTAIEAASRKDRTSDVKTRELPRLWRYKLLRVTLASYADDLPPSAYEVMALVERLDEAADLAALITDPGQQAQAFGGIAAIAAQQPERVEQAGNLLRRAYEAAARIAGEKERAANLQQLLDTSGFISAQVPAFEQPVREPAERLARSLGDLSLKTYALAGIARFLHAANDASGASALRDDVGSIARSVDAAEKGPLLACHTALCTLTGAFTLAHESVADIEPPIARLSALLDVAVAERLVGLATADATVAEASTLGDALSSDGDRARSRVFFAQAHLAVNEGGQAVPLLTAALDILRHAEFPERHNALAEVADGLRRAGALERSQDAVRLLHDLAIAELDQSAPRPGHGYTFSLRGAEIGAALSSLDQRDLALDVATHMRAEQRSSTINAVVRSFVRGGLWDEALRLATDLRNVVVDSLVRISFTAGDRRFDDSDQAFIDIIEGLRRAGEPTRALEMVDQLQSTVARVEALANVAAAQFETGGVDAAKELIERAVREVRLANSRTDRPQILETAVSLLVRARQWPEAERLAAAIEVPSTRFDTRLSIARALIQAGEFSSAEAAIHNIDSPLARAQALAELSERMRAGQPAAVTPADGLQGGATGLLQEARSLALQADDAVGRAAVLRSIAVGFFELGTPTDAHAAMMEAVEALNKAPRFAFTPTPWCATCVAFAKIGDSGWVSRISTGLLQHDAFDGCNALRDLATLARERQDLPQAEAWLAKARESAPKISFYPMRASLRASLAREYARLGKLDEAMQEDLIEARGEALDGIAFALAAAGRISDATRVLQQLAPADEARDARPALVDALLASDAVDEARAMAGTIANRSDKGAKLAAVAAALFRRDRVADAQAVLGEARALTRAESARRPDAGVLREVATVLDRAGHSDEALGLVEEEWLNSATREELVTLTGIADPLAAVVPDLGLRLHEGLDWVEAMLTDGA